MVRFSSTELFQLGKILIDQRLRSFFVFILKSPDLERKYMECLVSFDPLFTDKTKVQHYVLENGLKGNGQKIEVLFNQGFDKAVYFKFIICESENEKETASEYGGDTQRSCESSQQFLRVFI